MSNKNRKRDSNPETEINEKIEDISMDDEITTEETKEEVISIIEAPEIILKKFIINNCDKLNLRTNPNKKSVVVKILTDKDILEVMDSYDEWSKVITSSGEKGYVMKEFIKEM